MSAIATVSGRKLRAEFREPLTAEDFGLFMRCKALPEKEIEYDWETDTYSVLSHSRFASILGLEPPREMDSSGRVREHLFDYQRGVAVEAIAAMRFAGWLDCGMGKTAVGLEFARLASEMEKGGKVLILPPKGAAPEWLSEASKFYGDDLPIRRLGPRAEMVAWLESDEGGLALGTHGLMAEGRVPEFRNLTGLVLDEASVLKSGGGVVKWNLIHSAKGIPFKLALTATPAPNDTMEFASQASFLERLRDEGEILWTFFTRDDRGEWSVKPHAREAFFRFMAGWSIFLRDPAAYGWGDNLRPVPAPEFFEHRVDPTTEQLGILADVMGAAGQGLLSEEARLGVSHRTRLCQAARGFVYAGEDRRPIAVASAKPLMVAEIARTEVRQGLQTIVWTAFDEEERLVSERLARMGVANAIVGGKTPEAKREEIVGAFKRGDLPCILAKPSVIGYGRNLQECGAMVRSGIDDSYERWYQAVRRAYRYGQTRRLRVHTVFVPELEGAALENVRRKEARFESDAAEMERRYAAAKRGLFNAA